MLILYIFLFYIFVFNNNDRVTLFERCPGEDKQNELLITQILISIIVPATKGGPLKWHGLHYHTLE